MFRRGIDDAVLRLLSLHPIRRYNSPLWGRVPKRVVTHGAKAMNKRIGTVIAALAITVGLAVCSGRVGSRANSLSGADSLSGSDVEEPHEHFTIAQAAKLDKGAALIAYNSLVGLMMRGYAVSAEPAARRYLAWRHFNDAPYPSAAHGNRYVNNYANAKAEAAGYGRSGSVMPPGAIVVKDSFTASEKGRLWPGALFIMEKLADAASPQTAGWRYVMIMPDGSTFGDSQVDAAKTAFCHACHAARASDDYLFFVPEVAKALPAPAGTSPGGPP